MTLLIALMTSGLSFVLPQSFTKQVCDETLVLEWTNANRYDGYWRHIRLIDIPRDIPCDAVIRLRSIGRTR